LDAGVHPEDAQAYDKQVELETAQPINSHKHEREPDDEDKMEGRMQKRNILLFEWNEEKTDNHTAEADVRCRRRKGNVEDEMEGGDNQSRAYADEYPHAAGAEGFTLEFELVSLELGAEWMMSVDDAES